MKVTQAKARYTSSRESILSYRTVASLLQLDSEDRLIDLRLLNDSIQDVCFYMDSDLEENYNESTLPVQIKEALLATFIKKHSLYKKAADYAHGYDIDDVIEKKIEDGILNPDDFFSDFSTLPLDAEMILDAFMVQ